SDATISIVSPKLYISRTLPEASCRLARWSDTLHLQGVKGALEDLVHVTQEAIEVEHPVERGGVEQGGGLGVRLQQAPERHLLIPGAKGVSLGDLISPLARRPGLDHRQQRAAGEHQAVRRLEIPQHPLGGD